MKERKKDKKQSFKNNVCEIDKEKLFNLNQTTIIIIF